MKFNQIELIVVESESNNFYGIVMRQRGKDWLFREINEIPLPTEK